MVMGQTDISAQHLAPVATARVLETRPDRLNHPLGALPAIVIVSAIHVCFPLVHLGGRQQKTLASSKEDEGANAVRGATTMCPHAAGLYPAGIDIQAGAL